MANNHIDENVEIGDNNVTLKELLTKLNDIEKQLAEGGYLPLSGGTMTGDLRLKTGNKNYSSKLNFGDGDYVYISEPTDDDMEIKATDLTLNVSNLYLKDKDMKKYINALDHNGATCICSLTGDYKVNSFKTQLPVKFDTFSTSNSDVFTYDSNTGRVTINSDRIKSVIVQCNLRIGGGPNSNQDCLYGYISKNNINYFCETSNNGDYVLGTTMIPVSKGDFIETDIWVGTSNRWLFGSGSDGAWCGMKIIALC